MDTGLQFWLHYVRARGGLSEPVRDGTLVMLPDDLSSEFDLPDELVVTADPDVAREDGATFLATGHPVLAQAAESALAEGDVGVLALVTSAQSGSTQSGSTQSGSTQSGSTQSGSTQSGSTQPTPETALLEERVREQFPVAHGRIDVTGPPARAVHPMLRVGALVNYTLSEDERFQERVECWVDAVSGLELGPPAIARLARAAIRSTPAGGHAWESPAGGRGWERDCVEPALAEAHRVIDDAASRRRAALSPQASAAHQRERERARAYYAEVLAGVERRHRAADSDRAELLAARASSTRQERDRRLLEIDEKYRASHEIRPYRLHVVLVPGWRVPVDVRRGARRYPLLLDWLPVLGGYAGQRCPHCGGADQLSAGKARLGCRGCLPEPGLHGVPTSAAG